MCSTNEEVKAILAKGLAGGRATTAIDLRRVDLTTYKCLDFIPTPDNFRFKSP